MNSSDDFHTSFTPPNVVHSGLAGSESSSSSSSSFSHKQRPPALFGDETPYTQSQRNEDFRNISTLFEPLITNKNLFAILAESGSLQPPFTPKKPTNSPLEDKRIRNDGNAGQSREKLVELYTALKDAHFQHANLLFQKESVTCVLAVKKKKQKLLSLKDFTIDDIAEHVRNCHVDLGQWKTTHENILQTQKQLREVRTRSEVTPFPLDDVMRVLSDEWHAVIVALSRILAKLTKRIGRSYPTDGGAFPRLFDVLDRFFTLVRDVFAAFDRVYLRTSPNTIKSPRNSVTLTATPRNPSTASPRSARASQSPRVSSPRVNERSPSPRPGSTPPSSAFSFLSPFPSSSTSSGTPMTNSPVPKLALGAMNTISPNPSIKPLSSISAVETSRNIVHMPKLKPVLTKIECCKILARARAYFVFSNHPPSTIPPSLSVLEEIFSQETAFISSSPLHTPYPYDPTMQTKSSENLEIDFDFRLRMSSEEIPRHTHSATHSAPRVNVPSANFVDNAWYLEVFSHELCRLFRMYFAHCAAHQTLEALETQLNIPPQAVPTILSHQVALDCHRKIIELFYGRKFGTFQGNFFRLLTKEKLRLPPSGSAPFGSLFVCEPFKAIVLALDHATQTTANTHDLPAIDHVLAQVFSLCVAFVHYSNTPKILALTLPSLCILLSNIRVIANKVTRFCDFLNQQDALQSKLQRSRPRYQPTQLLPSAPAHTSDPPAYPAHLFRRHHFLAQQLRALHFQLLVVAGHLAAKIAREGTALVEKFAAAAPNENFIPRKTPTQEKAGFVTSSSTNTKGVSSLTSLSLPSVSSYTNEQMSPSPMTKKMVEKILDPAWATLLQCEPTTRNGIITIFMRAILVGLENVVTKKFPPRTLTHPVAVQIVTDLDFIKAWAIQAEETLRSIEGPEPEPTTEEVIGGDEENERQYSREPHPLQDSFKGPLAFRMTKLSSSKEISPNSLLFSSSGSSGSTKVLGRPKDATASFSKRNKKTELLPRRDFQRWTRIAEILTTCTSERGLTNEELENSPIPDAAKWAALCKR